MISHYRRRWTAVWLPAAILVFAPYGAFAQDAGDALAVLDVTVIPMSSETLLQHRTVLVEGGRIISVEAADSAEVPDGYRRIEGAGLYLLPGLTDLHVHIRNREELFHYLAWGVTTVMHLGGSGESGATIRDYREQVKAGRLAGPNIYTTDRVLDGDPALPASAHSLTDPGEASKVVEALAEDGFDFDQVKSFRRFLLFARDTIRFRRPMDPDIHWSPVASHVSTLIHGGGRYDHIFFTEKFNEGMQVVLDRIEMKHPIRVEDVPRFNESEGHGPKRAHPVADYFDDLSMHLVREMYHRDFEVFRYDIDDPSNKMPVGEIDLDEVHHKLGPKAPD